MAAFNLPPPSHNKDFTSPIWQDWITKLLAAVKQSATVLWSQITLPTVSANTFLGGPTTGSPAQAAFRNIVAGDIPTLNQNTTGTASNVTGVVAILNGGTGQTTQQAALDALSGAVTSGSYLRGNGTHVTLSTIQAADVPTLNQNTTGSAAKWTTARLLAGNSVDGSANVAFSNKFIVQGTTDTGLSGAQFLGALGTGLVKNTTTTGVLSIASAGTDYAPATSGTGILKGNGTGGFSTATGADVNTTFGSQTANTFYAAPNGSAGTPSFRAVVAADIPTLNQNTTGQAGSVANSLTAGTGISYSVGTTYNGSTAVTISNAGVTSFSAGTTGFTPSTSTTGAVTLSGTLGTANGGTNLTGFTAANNAIYSTSASALTAGTLPVAAGGTGATTLTSNNVILGNGSSAVQFVAPGASGNLLTSNGTTWTSAAPPTSGSTLGTPVASTSGTAILFTGVPSGVKEVKINLKGVSTSGTSAWLIQIGSGSVTTSGYLGASSFAGATSGASNFTTGFGIYSANAANISQGTIILSLENSSNNTWCAQGVTGLSSSAFTVHTAGTVSLAGVIDRVNITTVGGTDTFDAGEINISWSS